MKVVAVSGYFSPCHVGHLKMLRTAKEMGDKLVVIVNNDRQVRLKGSVPFMSADERVEIVRALRDVDMAFVAIDEDGSVARSLEWLAPAVFANGGDVKELHPAERAVCERLGVEVKFGVGGSQKRQSSSLLIARAAAIWAAKQQAA